MKYRIEFAEGWYRIEESVSFHAGLNSWIHNQNKHGRYCTLQEALDKIKILKLKPRYYDENGNKITGEYDE